MVIALTRLGWMRKESACSLREVQIITQQTSRKPVRQHATQLLLQKYRKIVVGNPIQRTTCYPEFGPGSCKLSQIFRAFLLGKSCIVVGFYYLIYLDIFFVVG